MNVFKPITDELAELLQSKREAYGPGNLSGTGGFFNLLFPDGIPTDRYQDALILARMYDKMSRIARGTQGQEDAWMDIGGYAICAMELRDRSNK